jgi:pimeloyl-ACP methyl ester carboxylesterase
VLASRIPDAELLLFPRLGHLLFWEDPDAFASSVTSFLLQVQHIRSPQTPPLPIRS